MIPLLWPFPRYPSIPSSWRTWATIQIQIRLKFGKVHSLMWMEVTTSPSVVHLLNETIVLLPKSHFWSVFRLRPQLLFKIPSFSCWTRLLTVNLSPPWVAGSAIPDPRSLREVGGDQPCTPLTVSMKPNFRTSFKLPSCLQLKKPERISYGKHFNTLWLEQGKSSR